MGGGVFRIVLLCMCGIQISLQAPLRSKEKTKKEEAIKIALESSDELIASPKMVEKIKSDLDLIRYSDPPLRNHIHVGKWKPGQLHVKEISKEQLDAVQESEFKPIKAISESPTEPGTILMVFSKPFHPEHLSQLLKLRFGFDSYPVPPEETMHKRDGGNEGKKQDEIIYNHDLSTYYFNPVNGKNCKKGCKTQYAVSVFVDENSEEDDWARMAWQQNAL